MKRSRWLAAALCAAAPALAWAQADGRLACGGVGTDAREKLAANAGGANLALEMFISPGGEYVADVDVTLRPLGTSGAALSVRTEGPICYLRIPPGRYRIDATFEGASRSAQANVTANPAKPARVAIAFPKSVGDRQTDAASPEEREQAARRP